MNNFSRIDAGARLLLPIHSRTLRSESWISASKIETGTLGLPATRARTKGWLSFESFIRARVAPAKLCVAMKANVYEHGLTSLAPIAVAAGADYLGIYTNPEAAAIRDAGFMNEMVYS